MKGDAGEHTGTDEAEEAVAPVLRFGFNRSRRFAGHWPLRIHIGIKLRLEPINEDGAPALGLGMFKRP